MKNDSVKQFVKLRDDLVNRKAYLEAELALINKALEGEGALSAAPVSAPAKRKKKAAKKKAAKKKKTARAKRARNKESLRVVAYKALGKKPMTRQEILSAVEASGYKFGAANPMASLNTVIYSNKKLFKNVGGKFVAAK